MEKIPVKIVEVTSPSGVTKKGVMLDVLDYFDLPGNAQDQVKKFEQLYFDTLEKAKKFIPQKGAKRNTTDFWKLSKLLLDLKESTKNEFVITNFLHALQRDFLFTGRYVKKILEFALYYKQNEILNSISLSYYVELSQKKNKLDDVGIFEKEKNRLLKMGRTNTLPGLMKYRKQLQKLLKEPKLKK